MHNRITYDVKITAFNAAAIVILGIILITNSVVWLVIFSGCYLVRRSIEKAVNLTGMPKIFDELDPLGPDILARVRDALPEPMQRNTVMRELRIQDEHWQLNQYKLLDFVVLEKLGSKRRLRLGALTTGSTSTTGTITKRNLRVGVN